MFRRVLLAAALALGAPAPALALEAAQLAVLYSTRDADSRDLARYYAARRGIPAHQVIGVDVATGNAVLPLDQFARLAHALAARVGDDVQAYAVAWTRPYRVACMSLTSALAFGFDLRYCAQGCQATAASSYFDSPSALPYRDHGMRPAMLLAGRSLQAAKTVVDRGIAADYTRPPGTAYLIVTNDRARSTRVPRYAVAARRFGARHRVSTVASDGIRERRDVMFYFTGTRRVPGLATLRFRPGAIADHLTSAGGVLDGHKQMNILAWLDAGATASYGTVVEPCNYPQKFPDPALVLAHYLDGEALIEAYWKSVLWPGQGLFVGEPLARPFGRPAAPARADLLPSPPHYNAGRGTRPPP